METSNSTPAAPNNVQWTANSRLASEPSRRNAITNQAVPKKNRAPPTRFKVWAATLNWPFASIAGTASGEARACRLRPSATAANRTGTASARPASLHRRGHHTRAKPRPPISVAVLWSQTNAFPGSTAAWAMSRSPIPARAAPIQTSGWRVPPTPNRMRSSSARMIAMKPPDASTTACSGICLHRQSGA